MLDNDMNGQAIHEVLSFKVGSGNHQRGNILTLEIFGSMRLISQKMTSYLTSDNFQALEIEIFSKPCHEEMNF